jgi:hypothetical protein
MGGLRRSGAAVEIRRDRFGCPTSTAATDGCRVRPRVLPGLGPRRSDRASGGARWRSSVSTGSPSTGCRGASASPGAGPRPGGAGRRRPRTTQHSPPDQCQHGAGAARSTVPPPLRVRPATFTAATPKFITVQAFALASNWDVGNACGCSPSAAPRRSRPPPPAARHPASSAPAHRRSNRRAGRGPRRGQPPVFPGRLEQLGYRRDPHRVGPSSPTIPISRRAASPLVQRISRSGSVPGAVSDPVFGPDTTSCRLGCDRRTHRRKPVRQAVEGGAVRRDGLTPTTPPGRRGAPERQCDLGDDHRPQANRQTA